MDALVPDVLALVAEHGVWLLFAMAVAETSFVTGLVVPSGLATSAATVLVFEGVLALPSVALAAGLGGWCGDTIGYWIGRLGRARLEGSRRRWARWVCGTEGEGVRFFRRHPAYSVTVARLVSFVRTLMPMAAGVSGLSWRRFFAYELVGLAGWLAMYMAVGALARESWRLASQIVGVGWTVVFLIAGLALWLGRRRALRARARGAAEPGTAAVPARAPEAPSGPDAAPPPTAPSGTQG